MYFQHILFNDLFLIDHRYDKLCSTENQKLPYWLTHLTKCCPVFHSFLFPWPNFSREESTLTVYTLLPFTCLCLLTHFQQIKVFIGSHSCGIRFSLYIQHRDPLWLGIWLVSLAQLAYLPALHAVILLSHLHNRTSYFVLVHSVPLMSSFPHHHLPQMSSPA